MNQMKSLLAVGLLTSFGISLSAQPVIRTINGVLNAASYAQQGMPNSAIAQGSTFTIFAEDPTTGPLGPAALQEVTSFPVSTTLEETSVNVTAGGKVVQAPMIFTIANQVAAVMPSTTPVGNASVSVTYKGATSAEYPIQVVASSFGTFAVNQQGNGTGDVVNNATQKVYLADSAALPGDIAILWGTGLGPVPYPDSSKPIATNLTNIPVKLYIGGQLVSTAYQGPSGCCAGLNEIVFKVPSGITGCSVPVEVSINGIVSPATTMPIASNADRVCSDPNGISSAILQTLLGKPSFNLGFVSLSRTTESILDITETTDLGSAGFFSIEPLQFAGATSFQTAAIGSCIVTAISESVNPLSAFTGLNAGSEITVNGPGGAQELTPIAGITGVYASTNGATPFLTPGSYTASSTGGFNVGKFSVDLTVADPIKWTNAGSISAVDRASGVTVTWTGGGAGTYATITGASLLTGPPAVVATFNCQAPIAQGTFTVGPDVLLQLPASAGVGGVGFGTLSVGNNQPYVEFTATGLDYGFAESSVSSIQAVTYQ
jgi:uncharacterized protein (TIGR03437 family)